MINHPDLDGDDLYEQLLAHATGHPSENQANNQQRASYVSDTSQLNFHSIEPLPDTDEDLERIQYEMSCWLSEMGSHVTPEHRLKVWVNSPFRNQIQSVQGAFLSMRPDFAGRIDSYHAVSQVSEIGLTEAQGHALILLRQLFVTEVRNLSTNELSSLSTRLRSLAKAIQLDKPHWDNHWKLVENTNQLNQKKQALIEQARTNGKKSTGRQPTVDTNDVHRLYDDLLKDGIDSRDIAGIIARRLGTTPRTIRRHLKKGT